MTSNTSVALVTGASSGIGKAAAAALAEAGFEVIGTSRDTSRLAPVRGVTLMDLDLADDESVASLVERVIERFGRIDVLVNNAGIGTSGAAEESSVAQDQRILDVNVLGAIRMMKAVLPHMRARKSGRIVNLSSVLGLIPQPYMAIYAASKHALEGYSESLDHEVREYGVRVLLVEPAFTNTSFDANALRPDLPLPAYEEQRIAFDRLTADLIRKGDDPAVVAGVIVAAATRTKSKLRYPAGPTASRVSVLRRLVPARAFDRQIRKLNRLSN